jgi:hypothetical protein
MSDIKKHPGGRPTLYKPEYCARVEEEMAKGFSLTAIAGTIGVCRATINVWKAEYPEFLEAVNRAMAKRLLEWETIGLKIAREGGGPGSATLVIFGLKNAGGDEWSDKTIQQHQGPNGGPVEYRNLDKLTDDELRVLQAIQMKLGDGAQ